eukprot:g2333.t1
MQQTSTSFFGSAAKNGRHTAAPVQQQQWQTALRCFSSSATSDAPDPAAVQAFADQCFEFFDENHDGFIVYSELEKAYTEKRAASMMARLFATNGLATKGITFDLIEDMDLMHAYKNKEIVALNNKISRDDFGQWVNNFMENYDKFQPDSLEGAQDQHE